MIDELIDKAIGVCGGLERIDQLPDGQGFVLVFKDGHKVVIKTGCSIGNILTLQHFVDQQETAKSFDRYQRVERSDKNFPLSSATLKDDDHQISCS